MKKLFTIAFMICCFCLNLEATRANDTVIISSVDTAKQASLEEDKPLLLIFSADWCKPCKNLHDDIDANLEEVASKYIVCHVDYDTNKELARKYGVTAIPNTVILRKNDFFRINQKLGYSNYSSYKRWLGL
jgi:thioredoxin 1